MKIDRKILEDAKNLLHSVCFNAIIDHIEEDLLDEITYSFPQEDRKRLVCSSKLHLVRQMKQMVKDLSEKTIEELKGEA